MDQGADRLSGESPLPGSEVDSFSWRPDMVEGARELSGLFYKGTNLTHEASTLMT